MRQRLADQEWWKRLPAWQRPFVLLLIPPVFLVTFASVLLLCTFVLAWNGTMYAYCWLRLLLFGIPMPSKAPHLGGPPTGRSMA